MQLEEFALEYEKEFLAVLHHPQHPVFDDAELPRQPLPTQLDDERPTNQLNVAANADFSAILASTLGISVIQIQPSDNLVMLGLDSISALKFVTNARVKGYSISAADVIRSPTVARLSELMETRKVEEVARAALPSHFSVPGMRWMLGAWQRSAGARYQYVFVFRAIGERLDASRCRIAWRSLVQQHVILRSVVVSNHSRRLGFVTQTSMSPDWSEETLLHIENQKEWIIEKARALRSRSGDPRSALASCSFVRLSQDDFLLFHLHHAAYGAGTCSH